MFSVSSQQVKKPIITELLSHIPTGEYFLKNSFDAEDVYFDMAEENLFIGADEKIYSVKLNMEIK